MVKFKSFYFFYSQVLPTVKLDLNQGDLNSVRACIRRDICVSQWEAYIRVLVFEGGFIREFIVYVVNVMQFLTNDII